jgi:5-methyltetrahydropteroyltriglutamate--homocysteine methyltransferase
MSKLHPRADHVGSLLRPASLLRAIEAETGISMGEVHATDFSLAFAKADQDAIGQITENQIRAVVAKQEEIGIGTITDGEFRRAFFMGSLDQAVRGFEPTDDTIVFHDDERSVELEGRPIVTQRLEVVGYPGADEARFTSSLTDAPVKVTFPAASSVANPQMFKPGVTDRHYAHFGEMASHLGQILRGQIDAAIEAGATYVQLDYPAYPLLLDPKFQEMMGADASEQALQGALAADRAIVDGLPDHVTTGMHLCRGNFRGMWMVDAQLDPVADQLFSLPYDNFLVEWDDRSRMGDYTALKGVPKDGPVVAMGLVSTKTGRLEDEDELVRHLEEASRYVDVEQLALCPQCGFASEAAGNDLTEDEQWAKLELVRRVADRVWGA